MKRINIRPNGDNALVYQYGCIPTYVTTAAECLDIDSEVPFVSWIGDTPSEAEMHEPGYHILLMDNSGLNFVTIQTRGPVLFEKEEI
ncbi:hypothetical protein ACFPYI_06905 [Halomarina salina]|uniref:Uncharacterized protein n=1 Tax=Halomarina salina TaxID=1872699 RepID=A0ABD5RKP6_9EURY|nr:hypothetical protein [Halomarina salina]